MEIQNNQGKNLKVHFQSTQNAKGQSRTSNLESGEAVDRTEQVKPQRLLERLEGDAKVRERLLVEIEAKVQAGEYLTRSAAVDAAQSIVDG